VTDPTHSIFGHWAHHSLLPRGGERLTRKLVWLSRLVSKMKNAKATLSVRVSQAHALAGLAIARHCTSGGKSDLKLTLAKLVPKNVLAEIASGVVMI
jgi:hypothetical protein